MVNVPTVLVATKLVQGESLARQYGIGIASDIQVGGWFAAITYGSKGAARSATVSLNQKTGPRVQDLLFLAFSRVDVGTGGAPLIAPDGATGTVTEHDGVVDITFEGTLPGMPKSTDQVMANFPGLPLI